MSNKNIYITINRIFNTDKTIQKGLMFIKRLSNNVGALFCMPNNKVHMFLMKNTYVSLDIIFMDQNFNVVGTRTNSKPLDLDFIFVNRKSKYIIEIKAGFVTRNNIQVGDTIIPVYIDKTQRRRK